MSDFSDNMMDGKTRNELIREEADHYPDDNCQCYICEFYYAGWGGTYWEPPEPANCSAVEDKYAEQYAEDDAAFNAEMNRHWELAIKDECPLFKRRERK